MRDNPVKQTLNGGSNSLGTFIFEFNTTGIARIAAVAGAEFVVFDMEHTGWSVESIRTLIATTPEQTVPIVRVPSTEYHFIARTLDMGAMGVMVPMVETVEQAKLIVHSAKYPPAGRRGAAFGIAHDDYQGGNVQEKMVQSNTQQLLIAQIETATGVENVDSIAAVEGIDVLWIGHFDLSTSLGIPAQFDHPKFQAAIRRVLEASREHGKIGGFMADGIKNARSLLEQGFRMIAYGGDLWLYQQALSDGLAAVRNSTTGGDTT